MQDTAIRQENLTARAQHTVTLACEEARRLGDRYVSTEHLLLGLLREDDTLAAEVLHDLGVAPDTLRAEVERRVTRGEAESGESRVWTPRALQVLRLSSDEAQWMRRRYIGTEHLLLGLLREREG